MVAKIKAKATAAGTKKKRARSFRVARASVSGAHTHSSKFFGGAAICSPHAVPKGGIKNSPAWKLLVKRCEGKLPEPAHKRLGAPIKGGFPVDKWPCNVLVDVDRVFWLPDDWGQGIKNTGPGGTYLGWVCPKGKFHYHRNYRGTSGVEVTAGRTLSAIDGFNGLLRKVEVRIPPGADRKFLMDKLSPSERKHVQPADAFHFAVVSARRATGEGQTDVLLVEAHFRHIGVRPTWYVDEGSVEDYRALGLHAIVGGKLTPARNLALEHARARNKVCVQVSDDISLWEYFNIPQLQGKQGDFTEMNAAVAKAELSGQAFAISPLAAAQLLLAKMRSHSAQPKLGGLFPLANMALSVGQAEFAFQHFILGDFFVAEPSSPCRFDTEMTLKEDYDYTASHLAKHGAVFRCNRMVLRVKHSTNAGGAVSSRDAAGLKEQANIAILQRKWPGVFSLNGRRKNEVIMSWSRLRTGGEIQTPMKARAATAQAKATPIKESMPKSTPKSTPKPTPARLPANISAQALERAMKPTPARLPASIPAQATVRWTRVEKGAPYMQKRCQRADGHTVAQLIEGRFTFSTNGVTKRYTLGDLKYDITFGRLRLESPPPAREGGVKKTVRK